MYTVEELIGNLLLRHNCVIVPSFGGFVAKQSSATIDYSNGVMLPPRKSVLFNRQLYNNDGLLVSEYASTNNVIYPTAEENILGSVADWNEKLRNGERVTLDRVGYLFYDQEKNICFEQDRFFNLLLESYGLGKVHFVTEEDIKITQHSSIIAAQQIEITKEEISEPTFKLVSMPIIEEAPVVVSENEFVLIEHPSVKSPSKLWKYVAAAVLLPIGFYSFWLPMKTNILESGILSIKDFNLAYKATEGTYQKNEFSKITFKKDRTRLEESVKSLPSNVNIYSYAFDDDTYIPVRLFKGTPSNDNIEEPIIEEVKETVKKVLVEEKKIVKAEKIISKPNEKTDVQSTVKKIEKITVDKTVDKITTDSKVKNFDFIVGSFASDESANVLIEKLKSTGLKAYLISDTSGKHRVSAGSAATAEEIKVIADKTIASGVSGWILKK